MPAMAISGIACNRQKSRALDVPEIFIRGIRPKRNLPKIEWGSMLRDFDFTRFQIRET